MTWLLHVRYLLRLIRLEQSFETVVASLVDQILSHIFWSYIFEFLGYKMFQKGCEY